MWARVVEVMLGCWLAMSPPIFHGAEAPASLWMTDLGFAAAVVVLALASFWRPTRHVHLAILAVGCAMIGRGMLPWHEPPTPVDQNHVLVGLLLLMFAVVPNHATQPPES